MKMQTLGTILAGVGIGLAFGTYVIGGDPQLSPTYDGILSLVSIGSVIMVIVGVPLSIIGRVRGGGPT